MKWIATALCALTVSSTVHSQAVTYQQAAIGGKLGFTLVNGAGEVDGAFDVTAQGDVRFSLGKYGAFSYRPSIGMWLGGDSRDLSYWYDGTWYPYEEIRWFALEVHMNFADFAYFFPVKQTVPVAPYAGIGVMISIQYESVEYTGPRIDGWDDTDVKAGFNMFAGAEFRLNERIHAMAEMRGRVGGGFDYFTLAGGMMFGIGR